jgi:hypothetical protein
LIGKPLVQLDFRQERYEADFRFALARLREYSEQVASLRGENADAAELDGLDEAEKTRLQGAIDDLAAGGPRTELAASRFKSLMGKAGQAVGSGLYKVVLDVATEAAKKAIMG